jgi:hypothetical protein
MKKKINLICALILIVICSSAIWNIYFMGYAVGQGVALGWEACDATTEMPEYSSALSFSPGNSYILHPSSNMVTAQGDTIPVIVNNASVVLPKKAVGHQNEVGWNILITLLFLCYIVAIVYAIICFGKFIVNAQRNIIFDHKNTKLLNKLGWGLIVSALSYVMIGLIQEYLVSQISLEFKDLSYSAYWTVPWETAVMGLVGLLSAQIWKKAIIMKEEQELTI